MQFPHFFRVPLRTNRTCPQNLFSVRTKALTKPVTWQIKGGEEQEKAKEETTDETSCAIFHSTCSFSCFIVSPDKERNKNQNLQTRYIQPYSQHTPVQTPHSVKAVICPSLLLEVCGPKPSVTIGKKTGNYKVLLHICHWTLLLALSHYWSTIRPQFSDKLWLCQFTGTADSPTNCMAQMLHQTRQNKCKLSMHFSWELTSFQHLKSAFQE